MNNKVENWRLSVEIDYLSMYIKTWFAFLASAKELYPSAVSTSGDGFLINAYIDNLVIPTNYDDEIRENIEKTFITGQKAIKKDLPESFFGYFYRINTSFQQRISHKDLELTLRYRQQLNGRDKRNIFISFKSTKPKFLNQFKKHHLESNILIDDDIIRKFYFDSKDDTANEIIEAMHKVANETIEQIPKIQQRSIDERKGYSRGLIGLLGQEWRRQFQIESIFEPLPVKDFPDGYDKNAHKLSILKWFIRFNYDLRNIMFHHVINPFDEDWLKLFKHTYLALSELVAYNIEALNNRAANTATVSVP